MKKTVLFIVFIGLAIFLLTNTKVVNSEQLPPEDYIPNDVMSWKDDPFLEGYDLSQYDSYKDFIIAQKSDSDRAFLESNIDPDYHDTSLYMIGNVSVSVILPESIGGNSTENWTPEEIAQVHAEVENGINWWAAQQPNAHLNFIYNYEDQVETTYEPIESSGISWWSLQVMSELGYDYTDYGSGTTATWSETVYAYVNDQRELKNTDWGFVVFVVDSSNDIDGRFSTGKFAWSVLSTSGGGPYLVMTYDNYNYGINNMDSIVAHETGHVFGAGDQYASSGCGCTSKYGYLYYENQNCENSCLINIPSIMKNNYPVVFANNQIDYYARGQLGWGDENSNGVLDIIDFEPDANYYFSGVNGNLFLVNGTADTTGMNAVNPYYANLIINEIADVQCSINNVDWNSGVALDGNFDELVENYSVSHGANEWGDYLFKVRAKDRFGGYTSEENYLEFNYQSMGCLDTDTTNDTKVKGQVENYNGEFGTEIDQCINSNSLRQYSCSGHDIVYADFNCLYGCELGVCLDKYVPMSRPTKAFSGILE